MPLCGLLLATLLSGCSDTSSRPRPAFYQDLAQPGAVLDDTTSAQILNSYRTGKGVATLVADTKLQDVAYKEAMRQAALGEITPGKDAALNAALKTAGFAPNRVKRSITGGYHSFADAFSGWRGAPHHDAVLLNPKVKTYGLAAYAAAGSKHRIYWVLLMAE